jgi:Flp pilus assembly protein TadG
MIGHFGSRRRSRGLAAVEFVIAIPLFVLVALALGEIGRAFLQYDRLSYFARNSARYVSEHAIDGTTGVVKIDENLVATAKNLAVYGKTTKGKDSEACVPKFDDSKGEFTLVPAAVNGLNDYFQLTVTYPYQPLVGKVLPTFGGGPLSIDSIPMTVVVTMRAIS